MERAPKPRTSAIVPQGAVRLNRTPLWVRPPAPELELAPLEPDPARLPEPAGLEPESAQAAAEPAAPPEPDPRELAREEAERILAEARAEAERLRREAREQGYAEGLKEGVEAGRAEGRAAATAELQGALDRWLAMGGALAEAWRARFDEVEAEARDLAVAIAERLVLDHLALQPDAVLAVVKDALRHAAEADRVTVRVSPKDVALVREARENLAGLLRGTGGRFEIVEDAGVEPGSCVVDTKTQVIDATRKTRIARLRAAAERVGG